MTICSGEHDAAGSHGDIAIEVASVTKTFKRFRQPDRGPFWHFVCPWLPVASFVPYTAVDDVSLTVRRGEVVGVLGVNGAGKTTLLKVIAGLLQPDRGSVQVHGTITPILALALAVHPDFTGWENLFYNGLLLGMSRQQILDKADEIIRFAELDDVIHRPFRTYSSGMKARLLFSSAVAVDPDILIIDEALATGDAHFVDKCLQRIRALCRSGSTALLVSHNYRQLAELCTRCIIVDAGRILFDGDPEEAVSRYQEVTQQIDAERLKVSNQMRAARGTGASLRLSNHTEAAAFELPDLEIGDVYFVCKGERTCTLEIGHNHVLHVEFICRRQLANVALDVQFYTHKSRAVFARCPRFSTNPDAIQPLSIPVGRGEIRVSLPGLLLGDGEYTCSVALRDAADPDAEPIAYVEDATYVNAVYRDPDVIGRGTLAEIPMTGIQVTSHAVSRSLVA